MCFNSVFPEYVHIGTCNMYDPYVQYLDQNVAFFIPWFSVNSLSFHSNLSEALVGGIISNL